MSKKLLYSCIGTALGTVLALEMLLYAVENAHSYESLSQLAKPLKLVYKNEEDADLGRPPNRVGGASRNPNVIADACPESIVTLVPGEDIVPLLEEDECLDTRTSNLTNRSTPAYSSRSGANVWIYIPQVYANLGVEGEIVLIDNHRKVESWPIALPAEAGIICVPLPYELEAENVYQWLFEVNVNELSPAENPHAGGLIEYTQQSETYWYDDLEQLGQQIWANPVISNPGIAQWQNLLESQGLGAIASRPVLNSCTESEPNFTTHNQLPTNTNGAQ